MANTINIVIGDWSGDGHSIDENYYFTYSDDLSVQDVREAFFKSVEDYPLLDPQKICRDYGDSAFPEELIDVVEGMGFELQKERWKDEVEVEFGPEEMSKYVAWFIGLSGVKLEACKIENHPTLAFYGFDEKQRHISFIGYGLLGW